MAKKALCIGINNYPGTHMDLQGCVNDANDWAGALSERGYAVTKLLDAEATKAAMMQSMSNLIGKAAKNDSLVITFSGHGTYQPDTDGDEADGLDEALCPYDLQTNGQALTDDEIKGLFATRKSGVRIVLIADSCHSGTVTRAAKAEDDADTRPRFCRWATGCPTSCCRRIAPASWRPPWFHRWAARPCSPPIHACSVICCLPAARKAPITTATTPGSRPLQRRFHLLRAESPEGAQGRRHLRRLAQGDDQTPALGELPAVAANCRQRHGTQRQGFRLTGAPPAPQPHRGASHGTASLQDSRHSGRQLGR